MPPGPASHHEGTVRVSADDVTHPDDSVLAAMAAHRLGGGARARLLRHLDQCARCREVLFTLEGDEAMEPLEATVARDPIVGMRLGEYTVLERLAEGGMGVVYRGEQPAIGKQVAIKVIRPEAARDPDLVARLQAEARAVNAIRHPNIVDIFSFGTLPDGRPYLVMELLQGHSLDELIHARGRLTVEETVTLLAQAMPPLAAAHAVQVVHRDLKPANIFLSVLPDGRWHITLLDFGLAKLLNRDALTNPNMVVGTPGYMSPEQIRGQQVSDRTDVYAMGIVAWELLAGKEPFEAPSLIELMRMHLDEPAPEIPNDVAVPRQLRELIHLMMAKRPFDRPSASAVSAELNLIRKALGDPPSQRFINPMPEIERIQRESVSVKTRALRPGALRTQRKGAALGEDPVADTRIDQPAAGSSTSSTDRVAPVARTSTQPETLPPETLRAAPVSSSDTFRAEVPLEKPTWRSRRWLLAALGVSLATLAVGIIGVGSTLTANVKSPQPEPVTVAPAPQLPPPPVQGGSPPPVQPDPAVVPTHVPAPVPARTEPKQPEHRPIASVTPKGKTRADVEAAIAAARQKAAKRPAAIQRIISLQLDELGSKLAAGAAPAQVQVELDKVIAEYELK